MLSSVRCTRNAMTAVAGAALGLLSACSTFSPQSSVAPPPTPDRDYVFLGGWQVLGPFSAPGEMKDALQRSYLEDEAHLQPTPGPVHYQAWTREWKPSPQPVLNLAWFYGPGVGHDHQVAYACTRIEAPMARDARLAIGADDAAIAWLNGEKVVESAQGGGATLDSLVANVHLRQGTNTLLLKVYNGTVDWGAFARLLPADAGGPALSFQYPINANSNGMVDLPEATVDLLEADGTARRSIPVSGFRESGSTALFRLNLPQEKPADKVRVRVDVPGVAPTESLFSWAEATAGSARIGAPGKINVEGCLVDNATGEPIANGFAWVGWGAGDVDNPIGRTDAKGHFVLQDVDPTVSAFEAVAPDHLMTRFALQLPQRHGADEIRLFRGGFSVQGRVTNEEGQPVAGALITTCYESALTDDSGHYLLPGILPNEVGDIKDPRRSVAVMHRDYVSAFEMARLAPVGTEPPVQDFVLKRGSVVTGRVTEKEAGRPIAGARVVVGSAGTTTGADGTYRLGGIGGGGVTVSVSHADWAPESVEATGLAPGKAGVANFALVAGLPIAGRVVDSEGKPAVGATIAAYRSVPGGMGQSLPQQAVTASDGSFRLEHMPADSVSVSVSTTDDSSHNSTSAKGGQTDLVIRLKGPTHWSGHILDAITRKPITSFRLVEGFVYKAGESSHTSWESAGNGRMTTSPDGSFSGKDTSGMSGDVNFRLRVIAPGYQPAESPELMAGQDNPGLEILLTPSKAVTGHVNGPDGKPLADATVRLFNNQFPVWIVNRYGNRSEGPTAQTAADGSFSIDGASDGAWGLYASKKGVGAAFVPEVLVNENPQPVTVQIQPFGTVDGLLVLGGKPVQKAVMTLIRSPFQQSVQVSLQADTDAQGAFHFDEVPAGGVEVLQQFEVGDGRTPWIRRTRAIVEPGRATFVALGGEGDGRVRGTVKDGKGQPISKLEVELRPMRDSGLTFSAVSDSQGSWEILDLPAGSYSLNANQFSRDGGETATVNDQVTVAEGATVVKDVVLSKPQALAPGLLLPALKGTDAAGREVALADGKEDRFLLLLYGGGDDEQTSQTLAWINKEAASLHDAGVPLLILTWDPLAKAPALTAPADPPRFLRVPFSWIRELSTRVRLNALPPPLLIDKNSTVLSLCPDASALKSALQEVKK